MLNKVVVTPLFPALQGQHGLAYEDPGQPGLHKEIQSEKKCSTLGPRELG